MILLCHCVSHEILKFPWTASATEHFYTELGEPSDHPTIETLVCEDVFGIPLCSCEATDKLH